MGPAHFHRACDRARPDAQVCCVVSWAPHACDRECCVCWWHSGASGAADAVARVYADIDQLEKVALAGPNYRIEERLPVLLSAALVLLLVGRLLGASVLRVLP